MSLGIRGKYIIGFDGEEHRLLIDGVVVVEGNRIRHVGKTYAGQVDRWIDAENSLVMPGLSTLTSMPRARRRTRASSRTSARGTST